MAAVAGVATHLPGIFYLLGLNAISARERGPTVAVINVLVFDAIWFTVPIAAFIISLRRPEAARNAIERGNTWARRYERQIAIALFALVGAYFAIKGAAKLLS